MTPKEKAKEIFNKMYQVDDIMNKYPMCFDTAKQCSLIAVDETISHIEPSVSMDVIEARVKYWQEVKSEIENL